MGAGRDVPGEEGAERHVQGVGGAGTTPHMLWSLVSFRRSAESSTTVLSPRFFHQCETSGVSATTSPALCTIGAAQFDAYSSDLAFGDVDDGGTVGVAVPGHDATRLDDELAHAEVPAVDVERRLGDIDRGDDGIGHANRLEIDSLAGIRLLLIGGAFAGEARARQTRMRLRRQRQEEGRGQVVNCW